MQGFHIKENTYLYLEVGKSLVCLCHPVRVLFLFEGPALTLACRYDLTSQLFCHAAPVALPAVPDQPFHAQGDLPVRTNLRRDLECSPANPAAPDFYSRRQ